MTDYVCICVTDTEATGALYNIEKTFVEPNPALIKLVSQVEKCKTKLAEAESKLVKFQQSPSDSSPKSVRSLVRDGMRVFNHYQVFRRLIRALASDRWYRQTMLALPPIQTWEEKISKFSISRGYCDEIKLPVLKLFYEYEGLEVDCSIVTQYDSIVINLGVDVHNPLTFIDHKALLKSMENFHLCGATDSEFKTVKEIHAVEIAAAVAIMHRELFIELPATTVKSSSRHDESDDDATDMDDLA